MGSTSAKTTTIMVERKFDKDPVVKMRCNLYGHPLAGLYLEIYSSHVFKKCGFQPVLGWEWLWLHPSKQLLPSSYEDDVKMAGKTDTVTSMWATLSKHLDIDPQVKAGTSMCIGVKQSHVELTDEARKSIQQSQRYVRQMLKRYHRIDEQMANT